MRRRLLPLDHAIAPKLAARKARIGGNAWLMDSARVLTANAVDLGEKPSVLSAVLKYHLTERGRECISHAMDVHGGKGIIMGPNNYLARSWQGAPITAHSCTAGWP
mgnify:CR=1 FL=1